MTLSSGSRLGPYEVLAPLGAGGMGEVYRARDTRLGREVAIKVLPAEVSGDAERVKRFEKEARSASALNHPNIVTIHDAGTSDGVSWIAMELVEGQTLRQLVAGGAMPTKKLLAIAPQIAEGLAAAHEVGLVHRDLKPENVMVTKDGRVKILDFGLAKLTGAISGTDEHSNLPTVTGTSPGIVMGTVGYMSPEQAAGHAVDYRSDQFSFGSILYEMVTGERAFQRKTAVDTLSAILNEEPEPIATIAPQTPPPLRWIVERCLTKEPRQRYGATEDLARDLANLRDHLTETGLGSVPTARSSMRSRSVRTLAAIAAGLVMALLLFSIGRSSLHIEPPTLRRLTFDSRYIASARFTPDGDTAVYTNLKSGEFRIYTVRPPHTDSALLSLPAASLLSISRSDELAIQIKPKTLARVPLAGGTPRAVLEDVTDADWLPDETNLAVIRDVSGKSRLEFPIGKVTYETPGWLDIIRVSPDGSRVATFEYPARGESRCSVVVIDAAGKRIELAPGLAEAGGLAWTSDGREVWYSGSRSGLDTEIRAVTMSGKERAVYRAPLMLWLSDVFRDGRVLFARHIETWMIRGLPPGETVERDYSWLDNSFPVELSKDGRTLLISDQGAGSGPNYAVGLRKMDGSPAVRLGNGSGLALSPDQAWVLAYLPRPEPAQLILLPTGAGTTKVLTHDSINHKSNATWFPDGKRILFAGTEAGHSTRLYVQNIDGGEAQPISAEGVGDGLFLISPNGKLAFTTDANKRWSLYPMDGGSPRPILGLQAGEEPIAWNTNGRFLYVCRPGAGSVRIHRLDVMTGRREFWRELAAPESDADVFNIRLSEDGNAYAYNYVSSQTDLYMAEGLK